MMEKNGTEGKTIDGLMEMQGWVLSCSNLFFLMNSTYPSG